MSCKYTSFIDFKLIKFKTCSFFFIYFQTTSELLNMSSSDSSFVLKWWAAQWLFEGKKLNFPGMATPGSCCMTHNVCAPKTSNRLTSGFALE